MDIDPNEYLRHREISFVELHPEPDQCRFAEQLLCDIDGIKRVQVTGPLTITVSYDLTRITLKLMEDALVELGFHLENSLLSNMKRALIYYTEETVLANLGCDSQNASTREVFINRYYRLRHGCRDERPEFWRRYS